MENAIMFGIFVNVMIRGINGDNSFLTENIVRMRQWQVLKRRHTFGEFSVLS